MTVKVGFYVKEGRFDEVSTYIRMFPKLQMKHFIDFCRDIQLVYKP
jgi:hypothetical protein